MRLASFAFAACAWTAAAAQAALPWLADAPSAAQALDAVRVLEAAREQGLEPGDYDAAALRSALDRARAGRLAPGDRARVEAALTQSLVRYLHELRSGRVAPRQVGARFDLPREAPPDEPVMLRDALAQQRVAAALQAAQPTLPMYAALRDALAHYRGLAGHAAWARPLPAAPRRKVSPGDAYAGAQLLAARLAALGDLPQGTAVFETYDGALVGAVRAFQERHGLAADGVIGAATFQQLAVTPAARAAQIALAMERLRWTPFMQGPRMVVINVPEFVLRAYEVQDGRVHVSLTSRIVVGKAMVTRTPLFGEAMRFVEFNPFWNVPPSIARNEIVPRLRRDPGYFEREGFEFVTPGGQVVGALSAANLDAVLRGGWRIRQRPGPRNALGGLKFVFPNTDNIYLHHTPATALFEQQRRDFSHGCIRVQHPLELAQFVLQDEPGWDAARIRAQVEGGGQATVALRRPVPVLIAYSTVIVKQSRPHFYADLYGHDALLARALQSRGNQVRPQ